MRLDLPGGARTTIHVAAHDVERTELRVALLRGQAKLEPWCAARGVEEAIVGGFFVRPDGTPLGEVRTRGVARKHVPVRGAVRRHPRVRARAGRRDRGSPRATSCPSSPRGDLLQAGPLLVDATAGPSSAARRTARASAPPTASSTPTSPTAATRAPRSGSRTPRLYAVAVDGRSRHDAGLTLEELAALMAALDCETAMNLDGGGSTSLISGGRLRNRPRKDYNEPEPGGRPISTALLFLALDDLDLQSSSPPSWSTCRVVCSIPNRSCSTRSRSSRAPVTVVVGAHQHVR